MTHPDQETVTQLLETFRQGDRRALSALFPLVYDELRAMAHRQRQRWHGDYTLNSTALVHEAYMKLVDHSQAEWQSRAHFLGVAAKAMRHILINYAQQRRAEKRGGDQPKLSLHDLENMNLLAEKGVSFSEDRAEMLLVLNEALGRLERISERQGRIVECRFFGGMTIADTATALDISPATVKRSWTMAQAWLYREMKSPS